MRKSIFDPDCCLWQVLLNGWNLAWVRTVVEVDTDTGLVVVAFRDDETEEVIDLHNVPNAVNSDGTAWFNNRLIVAEHQLGEVELVPLARMDEQTQLAHAYWQGRVDRTMGRTNWGAAHFPTQYDLQDQYDRGYREGACDA